MQKSKASNYAALSVLLGAAIGSIYCLGLRVFFGYLQNSKAAVTMTQAFLILSPVAAGYLAVTWAEKNGPRPAWQWFFIPWISIFVAFTLVALLNLEGIICIVFALPISLVFASLGGMVAGLIAARTRKKSGVIANCLALLPLLLAPLESQLAAPIQHRHVETQITIHASAQRVWQNIKRVPRISPSELPSSWTQSIGFPRPLEATLSFEGIGGVRDATFEGGLLFLETVTQWQPNHSLCFSIRADTAHIPATTLDKHVTIGGPYFDVLDGKYEIEPLPAGDILLHLSSDERLSTEFNSYAALWTDAVMRNIQQNILQVVKHRCESKMGSA